MTDDGTWATVYSDTLKNYISQSGKAAIAHVAYGHFIVLAEYDPSDDTFLVLDSAPRRQRKYGRRGGMAFAVISKPQRQQPYACRLVVLA